MANSIFIDTNIVLDFLEGYRSDHDRAVALFDRLLGDGYRFVISEDMLSTLYYIARNKEKVLDFIVYARRAWEIVPFGGTVIDEAVSFARGHNTDFEDTLQCMTAKHYGCTSIVTSDRTFVDCGIRIVDYTTFTQGAPS